MLNHCDFIDWALNEFKHIQWRMGPTCVFICNPKAVIKIRTGNE